MATVKINNLDTANQPAEKSVEMLQLSKEDTKFIVGGYESLAFVATDLQVAWCCCGGGVLV
jgi:hypothetical protein